MAGDPEKASADIKTLIPKVQHILDDIKKSGDEALSKYTFEFDKVTLSEFKVEKDEIEAGMKQVGDELKNAINLAAKNIEKFHLSQKTVVRKIETQPGVMCWQKSIPIEKVGLYIPGGTAPLFSTVLMLAIPANIAGCSEIIICTPPLRSGKVHPAILYAAKLTGVTGIYKLGGVQAIVRWPMAPDLFQKYIRFLAPGTSM